VSDFDISAFPRPSEGGVIQQAPLGLSLTPQQDTLSGENIIGAQLQAAPSVPDLGDRSSYPNAFVLEEDIFGRQYWPAPSTPNFDVGAFFNPSDLGASGLGVLDFGAPDSEAVDFGALGFDALDFGTADFGAPDFPAFPDPSRSVMIQQAPISLYPAPQQPPSLPRFPCAQPGCNKSFKRDSDRTRHPNTVHNARPGLHLCPVHSCSKSHGTGYRRADKLTEYKWKKHPYLYTKRELWFG
jgi:hypothetical protein